MNNKFKLMILAITLLIGVMLPITSINAIMHHDYKHIDDINYINIIHNFDDQTFYTSSGYYGNEFNLHIPDNTNIFGIPNDFETTLQVGYLSIYFTSNRLMADFNDIDIILTISNNGGFSYNYVPYKFTVNQSASVYHLTVDFESGFEQQLDIATNTWYFDLQIIGDFDTGDYINVYKNHGSNTSSFSWYYYKDYDSMLSDYERGWVDGFGAGYNNWYESRYQLGLSEGYDLGYDYGYDLGYDDGQELGQDVGYDLGYDEVRADYGEFFPPGSPDGFEGWYGFQDGYDYGRDIGYTNGLRDGEVDEVIAKMDQWIVPAIILVLIGGGFIAFAKYRGSKNE